MMSRLWRVVGQTVSADEMEREQRAAALARPSARPTETSVVCSLGPPEWVLPAVRLPHPTIVSVVIFTCDRASCLALLLDDLEREAAETWCNLRVTVYDDASEDLDGYRLIESRLSRHGWRYCRTQSRHGRDNFRLLWVKALTDLLAGLPTDYYCFLPDDWRLCDRFMARVVTLWEGIQDDRKAALVPLVNGGRDEEPCWTGYRAALGQIVDRIGWWDCGSFSDGRVLDTMLQAIKHAKLPSPPRLGRVGSGVGRAVTLRLAAEGWAVYRSHHSLAAHMVVRSAMHRAMSPEVPRISEYTTLRYVDGPDALRKRLYTDRVVGHVCSVAWRRASLANCVRSFAPQVDVLHVHLNGYEDVPNFLARPDVVVHRSQDLGDLGSCGKFVAIAEPGYHVLIDDDLVASPEYVQFMLMWVEAFGRRAVVALHGAILAQEFRSYYRSRRVLSGLDAVEQGDWVHVPGSGAAAWHQEGFCPSEASLIPAGDIRCRNMSDITLALACQQAGVPIYVPPHPAGLIVQQAVGDGIYEHSRRGSNTALDTAALQTRTVRAHGRWVRRRVEQNGEVLCQDVLDIWPDIADAVEAALPPEGAVELRPVGTKGAHRLYAPPGDHVSRIIGTTGLFYEAPLLDAIRALAPQGYAVDVGAHIGNHAVYLAEECGLSVVAIEANPDAFGFLRANAVGRKITPVHAAIAERWTEVEIVGGPPWNLGMAKVKEGPGVRAVRLNTLLMSMGLSRGVGVMKVDVEGMEAEVLRSAANIIAMDHPLLAVEVGQNERRRTDMMSAIPTGYVEIGRYGATPVALLVWRGG